jgi:predicted cupin superfamily sugar epimerase
MKERSKQIIETLKLIPHPEGGWYKRTYESKELVGHPFIERNQNEPRFLLTAIYYFLTGQEKSHFHRIKSDEMWHFYSGDSLTLIEIIPEKNEVIKTKLGLQIYEGERPQYTVKKGHWFAGYLENKNGNCLLGCTVSPGFDFKDFEMAESKRQLKDYETDPLIKSLIKNS